MRLQTWCVWAFALATVLGTPTAAADPVETRYEYDELGNRTRVENLLRLTDAAVVAVEPRAAIPGDRVNIYGRNFPWPERAATIVMFGDTPTQPLLMSERVITVEVPEGAATGALNLILPGIGMLEAGEFAVEGVAVDPAFVELGWGEPASFTADLVGVTGGITWSVDGVSGGNADLGTIDDFGFYTAPSPSPDVPLPFRFRVEANAVGTPYTGVAEVVTRPSRVEALPPIGEVAAGEITSPIDIVLHTFDVAAAERRLIIFNESGAALRASLVSPTGRIIEQATGGGTVRWTDTLFTQSGQYEIWVSSRSGNTSPYTISTFPTDDEGPFVWVGLSGNWDDTDNWSRGLVPTADNLVRLQVPGDGVVVTHRSGDTAVTAIQATNELRVSGGQVEVDELSSTGPLSLPGSGDLSLGVDSEVGSLEWSNENADLRGPGELRVTGATEWTGGWLRGGARLVAAGGLTVSGTGSSADNKWIDGELVNEGVATASGAPLRFGFSPGTSGVLRNASGGVLTLEGSIDLVQNQSGDHAVVNAGELVKSGGGPTDLSFVRLANTGVVRVESGELRASGGGVNSGVLEALEGATLRLSNVEHEAGATVGGEGDLELVGAGVLRTPLVLGGDLQVSGDTTFEQSVDVGGEVRVTSFETSISGVLSTPSLSLPGSGDLSLGVDSEVGSLEWSNENADLRGPGELRVTGATEWTGGWLRGGARLVAAGGLTVSGTGSSADNKWIDGELVNEGVATASGSPLRFGRSAGTSGVLRNASGGVLTLEGSIDLVRSQSGDHAVVNAGELVNEGVATDLSGVRLENTGVVRVESGELRVTGGGVNSGVLEALEGATLRLSNVEHEAGATVGGEGDLELVGTTAFVIGPSGNFGRIDTAGTIDLAGTLTVTVDSDFDATLGEQFPIIRGGLVNNAFSNGIDIDLGEGLRLRSRIEPDGGVTLEVVED